MTAQVTVWDGILINAVAAFLVEPVHVRGEEADRIALIKRAASRASIDTERMGALVAASEQLVTAFSGRLDAGGGAAWSRARLDAGVAVAAVLTWRVLQLVVKLPDGERRDGAKA